MPVTPVIHAYMQRRVTGLALYWECSTPSHSSHLNQRLQLWISFTKPIYSVLLFHQIDPIEFVNVFLKGDLTTAAAMHNYTKHTTFGVLTSALHKWQITTRQLDKIIDISLKANAKEAWRILYHLYRWKWRQAWLNLTLYLNISCMEQFQKSIYLFSLADVWSTSHRSDKLLILLNLFQEVSGKMICSHMLLMH